jgi:hypothetical protein
MKDLLEMVWLLQKVTGGMVILAIGALVLRDLVKSNWPDEMFVGRDYD